MYSDMYARYLILFLREAWRVVQDIVMQMLKQSVRAVVLKDQTKATVAWSLEVTQAMCNGTEGQYKMHKENSKMKLQLVSRQSYIFLNLQLYSSKIKVHMS